MERRHQERELERFREESIVLRIANRDDGATAAVFHGTRQMSRRERIMAEYRAQLEAELRKKARRHVLAVRRGTGEKIECRHCGKPVRAHHEVRKCDACRANPELVTARGTESRSFVPKPEPQPQVTPLSASAQRIDRLVHELPSRERDALERRYLERQSDHKAAEELRISPAAFAMRARMAVALIAGWLASELTTLV